MKHLPLFLSALLAAGGASAAEPKAADKPAAAASARSDTMGQAAQPAVRRKPYVAATNSAHAATGPGTQTEDDVYVGLKKK